MSFGVFHNFSLGTAAITQNLLPTHDTTLGKTIACLLILIIAIAVVWAYDRGSKGVKIFDGILKIMVGLVVVSFFGVVIKLGGSGQLDWPSILRGFIPNLSMLHEPAEVYGISIKCWRFSKFLGSQNYRNAKRCNDISCSHCSGYKHDLFHAFCFASSQMKIPQGAKI